GGAAGNRLPDRPGAAVVVVVLRPAHADEDRVEAAAVVVRVRGGGGGDAVGVVDDHAAVVDAMRGDLVVGLRERVADRDDGDEPDRRTRPDQDPLAART